MIYCHDEDLDDLLLDSVEDELANACSDQSDCEDISPPFLIPTYMYHLPCQGTLNGMSTK